MPTSILTVNGTAYPQSGRRTSRLLLDAWGWDDDADFSLEFHEYSAGPIPLFSGPYAVSLTIDGTLRFSGEIADIQPTWSDTGRTWGYSCLGRKHQANQIPVTNSQDGSGLIVYNLPADDEDYIQANSGLSLGTILGNVLTAHSSALSAIGVSTDATTTSQLAALTLVPDRPVYLQGAQLWASLESVLLAWSRNSRFIITPAGLVRIKDITTGTSRTLTIGTDPIDPPMIGYSWRDNATRTVVRGRGKIYPGYVSLTKPTGSPSLTPAWSAPQQAAWTWDDFVKPKDAYDEGDVTSVLGPTSVRIQSTDTSVTWASNFWNTRQAWIYLTKTTGTGLTYQEARPVSACTAMTAGGTCDITLGYALDNSATGAWDKYELIGKVGTLADGGLNNVWRLFDVTDPGGQIADHLVKKFPVQVAFQGLNNASAIMTNYPVAQIFKSGTGNMATFRILPATGQVLFDRPVVELINQLSTLQVGGGSVVAPDDIYMLLAYSRGALQAVYPPDSGGSPVYNGTAYSAAGLQRSRYVDVDNWGYEGSTATMVSFATMLNQSMRDTVATGWCLYKGYYSAVLDPVGGHLMRFPGNGYTSGLATADIPLRAFRVLWQTTGGGLQHTCQLTMSNRRDPRTGESMFMHTSRLGSSSSSVVDGLVTLGKMLNINPSALSIADAFDAATGSVSSGFASANDMASGGFTDAVNQAAGAMEGASRVASDALGLGSSGPGIDADSIIALGRNHPTPPPRRRRRREGGNQ